MQMIRAASFPLEVPTLRRNIVTPFRGTILKLTKLKIKILSNQKILSEFKKKPRKAHFPTTKYCATSVQKKYGANKLSFFESKFAD